MKPTTRRTWNTRLRCWQRPAGNGQVTLSFHLPSQTTAMLETLARESGRTTDEEILHLFSEGIAQQEVFKRPALTAQLKTTIPADMRRELRQHAKARHLKVSDIAREAPAHLRPSRKAAVALVAAFPKLTVHLNFADVESRLTDFVQMLLSDGRRAPRRG